MLPIVKDPSPIIVAINTPPEADQAASLIINS